MKFSTALGYMFRATLGSVRDGDNLTTTTTKKKKKANERNWTEKT